MNGKAADCSAGRSVVERKACYGSKVDMETLDCIRQGVTFGSNSSARGASVDQTRNKTTIGTMTVNIAHFHTKGAPIAFARMLDGSQARLNSNCSIDPCTLNATCEVT